MSSFGDRVYQLFGWRRQEPEAMVLWLGLDGCGKTTLLKHCAALKTNHQGLEDNLDMNRNGSSSSSGSVTVDEITNSLPTQGHEIKSMEDLPPAANYILPNWTPRDNHYRATAWAYLNRVDGGDTVLLNGEQYSLVS